MFKESRLKKIAEAEPKDRPPHKKNEDVTDAVLSEREQLFHSALPDSSKVDGMMILNALAIASQKDGKAFCGLLAGYRYFIASTGFTSAFTDTLLAEYEKIKESEL